VDYYLRCIDVEVAAIQVSMGQEGSVDDLCIIEKSRYY